MLLVCIISALKCGHSINQNNFVPILSGLMYISDRLEDNLQKTKYVMVFEVLLWDTWKWILSMMQNNPHPTISPPSSLSLTHKLLSLHRAGCQQQPQL